LREENRMKEQLSEELARAQRRIADLEEALENAPERAEERARTRARRQAAVADLGQRALGETGSSLLMDEAVALVSRILDVEYAQVLELLPEGDALLLKAGVGWREGLVGEATVSAGTDSQAGYTLLSSEPVVVENLREETRFSGPPLLTEHGVVSGMSVIIRGKERPYGVLGAHTTERRTFTKEDIDFLQTVSNVLAAAIRRRRAEEAIRRSEERFRLLVEGLKDYAIFVIDPDGRVVSWNAGAERIFGYREEEIVGRHAKVLFTPEDARRGAPEQELKTAASEGRAEDERWQMRKDGTRLFASGVVTPLPDDGNGPRGFLKAARDVTERVRAQEAMREIREGERRRIARDLHDMVLQDLVSALQSLQLARARSKGAEPSTDLEQEIEALKRAASGVRGTIYDLRLEKDQPFVKAVESLVELNRQMTPERQIRLAVQEGFPQELPEKVRVELLRVIQEALANARRHSGARHVEVTLSKEGDEVRVEVLDDGRGFDPEKVRDGVGLSGMRERAATLGGELEIRSKVGKGTRVAISIPLRGLADDTPGR
jgi:PAS domain S-box-containing protein